MKEFKDFALRGNVVDLAIAVIIGAAFGKVVESLVGDIFMPLVGAMTHGLDFSDFFIKLSPHIDARTLAEAKKQGAVFAWGNFLTIIINFVIVAFVIFLVIKQINRLKRKQEEAPSTRECEFCVSSIPIKATRCPHCTSELKTATA